MGFVRFIVLAISALCLTQIVANQNTYNFTKICVNNETDASANYTSLQKSMISSATAIGTLAASIPLTLAMDRFKKKYVLLAAGLISTIATALIPLMESLGFGYFLAARIFQGMATCVTYPMAGAVTASWAGLSEHGLFVAFMTSFTQVSNIYVNPLAGALCSSDWGWRSVYYVMVVSGLILFTLFAILFDDGPAEHRWISDAEREYILSGKHIKREKRDPVPYKAIFSSLTIWGIWSSGIAHDLSIQFVNMFNPQYLKDYLHYNVLDTGILGMLPILVQWGCKLFAGISSDLFKCVPETPKLKIYNTISLDLSALFFIVLSFMPTSQPTLCMIILIISEGVIGFNSAGFHKCATLHARQHAHFIMVMIVNIQSLAILIEPFIVNAILTDNTSLQWAIVFWLHAVILFGASVLFLCWADSRPAAWTELEPELPRKYTVTIVDHRKLTTNTIETGKYRNTILSADVPSLYLEKM